MHRRIGPPQKRLRQRCPIREPHLDFEICLAGIERETVHAARADHAVDLVAPDGRRAVIAGNDIDVDRLKRAGPMMLRPIELDPAADPGPRQADQRRLDHAVVVDEVIVVRLVERHLNPAAELGQNHDLEIFVFEKDGVVVARRLLVGNRLHHRIGVNCPAAPLVHALFQEERIGVRLASLIRGDRNPLVPGSNGVGSVSVGHDSAKSPEKLRRNGNGNTPFAALSPLESRTTKTSFIRCFNPFSYFVRP